MKNISTQALDEARRRLRATVEDYIRLDAELRALENTNYRVCIFGSARIRPQDPMYHNVFRLAQSLSQHGIDVVTGGGPGLMAAANRGVLAAKRRRSTSYGLPLELPTLVEPANRALDVRSGHKRFSSRLDEFIRLSHGVVVAPGGIGTMLELMYVWQLIQLRAVEERPFILLDRKFWSGLLDWMEAMPGDQKLLDRRDLDSVVLVDTAEQALEILLTDQKRYLDQQILEGGHQNVPTGPERLVEATRALAESLDLENATFQMA